MTTMVKTTKGRIGLLFVLYMALPALSFAISLSAQLNDWSKSFAFLVLLAALPLVTIALAGWDGVKSGFNFLWLLAPVLCFLLPMIVFFNASALIYGVAYSVLALAFNAIGAFFHSGRTR
ncbi:iron ABC transporter [Corynebacterium aquilae]|uniref:Iron ABC transporter n=1 Tax=Corynebacterium aquilae DSM 44791 TaxID=1431546 RepID=A0A1L7CIE6_9CORY|nr:iron ABC transporter [Corynebacterium aquilae]APT85579.1 iron ABC transporter [Corynebacterium aquilae DSM 44791]